MRPLRSLLLVASLVALALACAAGSATAYTGLRVRGDRIVFGPGGGRIVQLRGANRSGTEYACIQGWGVSDGPVPAAIDSPLMVRAMLSWEMNAVRVPLNEDCWLGINAPTAWSGPAYRVAIQRYVRDLNASGLFAVIDLHWAAPGSEPATRQLPMADADHAPAFWRSVARAFRADGDVLFDLYNEPYGISWSCWQHGCEVPAAGGQPAYRAAGMQQLVDAVRSAGARQPIMLGGLQWASDLTGWLAHEPRDPRHALVAAQHNYGGLSPCGTACLAAVAATARRVPVTFGELGETDCSTGYIEPMMRWADARGIGYLGWAWDATSPGGWNCASGPALISSWDGTPTPYGAGLRARLQALGPPVRP